MTFWSPVIVYIIREKGRISLREKWTIFSLYLQPTSDRSSQHIAFTELDVA